MNTENPNDTLIAATMDTSIPIDEKLEIIATIFNNKSSTWIAYDVKSQYHILVQGCGIVPTVHVEDPNIACWMLDPESHKKTLHGLVTNCLPAEVTLLEGIGGGLGSGNLGSASNTCLSGRYRAAIESVLALRLMDLHVQKLQKEDLLTAFKEVEMPSVITLAKMELNGFGFSNVECENQKTTMTTNLCALETEAYKISGHPFCLSSTKEIAQVLSKEQLLPVNDDKSTDALGTKSRSCARPNKSKPQYCTSKVILEKLKNLHPLPNIILEWRRISSTLTKHVFPLQSKKMFDERLSMDRIFGICQYHTTTGRVSMREPNIQNVPKDFEITMPDTTTDDLVRIKTRTSRMSIINTQCKDKKCRNQVIVSVRRAFIPYKGGVILAADYSQLELRVIAHLSQDKKLIAILNTNHDVFKEIASQWLDLRQEKVSTEQRQQAKQICYGILYGMGPKSLAEQISILENDAAIFIDSFKSKYPGLRKYLLKSVEGCRKNGYVRTITGRKRYLPAINSHQPHAKAQAERQAINTIVQGSAADIVKTAMKNIDKELVDMYPDTIYPHSLKIYKGKEKKNLPEGAFLVLQLHDELIYEVSSAEIENVLKVIKQQMENAMKLSVPLSVKMKMGQSWGSLE